MIANLQIKVKKRDEDYMKLRDILMQYEESRK